MEIAQTDEHCFTTKVRRGFSLDRSARGQYGLVVVSLVEIHMAQRMVSPLVWDVDRLFSHTTYALFT